MTIVRNRLLDGASRPLRDQTVRIQLVANGNPFLVGGTGEVIQTTTVSTDPDGWWQADLIPTADYETGTATYYRVDERDRLPGALTWFIHVPDLPGPLLLRDLLITPPPSGGPVQPLPAHGLGDHTDVDLTGAEPGDVLAFDGTTWRPTPPTTGPAAPAAPTGVTATAGVLSAEVAFTPAAGPAATSFTVTASPGAATASGAASPLTVTGLMAGTAYTFTVTATNAAGTSAPSAASAPVTPTAPPAVLPSDDFNAPDGPLDVTSSGAAWTNPGGWSRSAGRAVNASSTPWQAAYVDAGDPDMVVTAKFRHNATGEDGVIARVTDWANLLFLDLQSTGATTAAAQLYRRTDGTFTAIETGGGGAVTVTGLAVGEDVLLELECSGTSVIARVNGVQVQTATDSSTATGAGLLRGAGEPASVDDFAVTNPGF